MDSKKLRAHFVSGLLLLAPAFLTLIFVGWLIRLADHFIVNPLFHLLPFPIDTHYKIILTKIAVGICVLLFVTLLGLAAEKFLFRRMFESGESVLAGIPVFNRVYLSFKEISQAVFGDKSGIFKRVVVVEFPRTGLYAIGFVTQEKQWVLSEKIGRDLIGVFLPHPPNPASGYLVFVPKEDLVEVPMSVEEAIRLVVSAGAAVPMPKVS